MLLIFWRYFIIYWYFVVTCTRFWPVNKNFKAIDCVSLVELKSSNMSWKTLVIQLKRRSLYKNYFILKMLVVLKMVCFSMRFSSIKVLRSELCHPIQSGIEIVSSFSSQLKNVLWSCLTMSIARLWVLTIPMWYCDDLHHITWIMWTKFHLILMLLKDFKSRASIRSINSTVCQIYITE